VGRSKRRHGGWFKKASIGTPASREAREVMAGDQDTVHSGTELGRAGEALV